MGGGRGLEVLVVGRVEGQRGVDGHRRGHGLSVGGETAWVGG